MPIAKPFSDDQIELAAQLIIRDHPSILEGVISLEADPFQDGADEKMDVTLTKLSQFSSRTIPGITYKNVSLFMIHVMSRLREIYSQSNNNESG